MAIELSESDWKPLRTQTMSDEGFNIIKSRISQNALAEFLADEVREDITSVPGIGKDTACILSSECQNESPIETTHQLIGRFLTLRGPEMTAVQHTNAFWYYLKMRGVNRYRSGIVHAVAEKVNLMIPGTFSLEALQEDVESDSLPDYESSDE
jgi:hypothetical protein